MNSFSVARRSTQAERGTQGKGSGWRQTTTSGRWVVPTWIISCLQMKVLTGRELPLTSLVALTVGDFDYLRQVADSWELNLLPLHGDGATQRKCHKTALLMVIVITYYGVTSSMQPD